MSVAAYQNASQATATPREIEFLALSEMTRRLIEASAEDTTAPVRIRALYDNLRLWETFTMDLVSNDNQLPNELRARLISLGLWVERYTLSAMKTKASLEPLIAVNREIAGGLSAAPSTAPNTDAPTQGEAARAY